MKSVSLSAGWRKKKIIWKFLIGAGALFVLVLILNFFSSGIRNGFYAVSSPVEKTFWSAGEACSGFASSFVNAGSLSKQNQNLQGQVQQLQSQLTAMQEVINGNQAQSVVSQACQNNGFKLQMAGVVGLSDQDIMSINKGSADGIKVNMPVINQQGALYGKISKVYKNFSDVMLISNKNSVISVKVQQEQAAAQAQQKWAELTNVYKTEKSKLKIKDFDDVESDFVAVIHPQKQGDILKYAKEPAKLIYALGKDPAKLKVLQEIDNPIDFVLKIKEYEEQMKTVKRSSAPPPESRLVSGTGSVVRNDAKLAQLEAEADRTGNRTALVAYRRSLNK